MNFNLEVVKEAIAASSKETKIYIGCDSKRNKLGSVKFATVVILHHDGKHGGKIYSKLEKEQYYDSALKPKMRLLAEAQKAVDMAYELIEVIGDRAFEVHLDLNSDPKYKSNVAVKEALGYVLGMLGFEAQLKPYAFAASKAADKLANK